MLCVFFSILYKTSSLLDLEAATMYEYVNWPRLQIKRTGHSDKQAHLADPSCWFVLLALCILHYAHHNEQSAHIVKCVCCKVHRLQSAQIAKCTCCVRKCKKYGVKQSSLHLTLSILRIASDTLHLRHCINLPNLDLINLWQVNLRSLSTKD